MGRGVQGVVALTLMGACPMNVVGDGFDPALLSEGGFLDVPAPSKVTKQKYGLSVGLGIGGSRGSDAETGGFDDRWGQELGQEEGTHFYFLLLV